MKGDSSDEKLMILYQLGDEDAFNALYRRHSTKVLSFLRRKTDEAALANDVFQASFLKLHNTRSAYDPSIPFSAWLFTICKSELLDAIKRQKRSKIDFVEELPEIETIVNEQSTIETGTLNERQQEVIEMRFREDLSFEEIARRLGTSPLNARQLVSRSIKILRGLYAKK